MLWRGHSASSEFSCALAYTHSTASAADAKKFSSPILSKRPARLNVSRTEPVKPREFVTRFISELELPQNVELLANKIVTAAEKRGCTSGKNAQGVAAAAIYLSSRYHKEHRTQRDIAKVSQVTEVTVRNHFKQLVQILKIPVDVIKKK